MDKTAKLVAEPIKNVCSSSGLEGRQCILTPILESIEMLLPLHKTGLA